MWSVCTEECRPQHPVCHADATVTLAPWRGSRGMVWQSLGWSSGFLKRWRSLFAKKLIEDPNEWDSEIMETQWDSIVVGWSSPCLSKGQRRHSRIRETSSEVSLDFPEDVDRSLLPLKPIWRWSYRPSKWEIGDHVFFFIHPVRF